MVAGHLQQKKGYWYMVLNLHDEAGRRKTKWIATHLPVPGNRKRAEEMLFQIRHQYADSGEDSGLLFADYMLQWLGTMRAKVSPTTYTGYQNLVKNSIFPYFRERHITLTGLRPSDLQADGKGEDRTVFPKHRADAGRNPSQAHSELLSA